MQGSRRRLVWMVGCVALAAMTTAPADVYRWKDAEGNVHFSDSPPKQKKSQSKDVQDVQSIETATVSPTEAPATDSSAAASQTVVMYATEWCPHCERAREYFRANGIDFKEYDVQKSAKGKRFMERTDAKGVPVIIVGNRRMSGFSPARFDQLYDQAQ